MTVKEFGNVILCHYDGEEKDIDALAAWLEKHPRFYCVCNDKDFLILREDKE